MKVQQQRVQCHTLLRQMHTAVSYAGPGSAPPQTAASAEIASCRFASWRPAAWGPGAPLLQGAGRAGAQLSSAHAGIRRRLGSRLASVHAPAMSAAWCIGLRSPSPRQGVGDRGLWCWAWCVSLAFVSASDHELCKPGLTLARRSRDMAHSASSGAVLQVRSPTPPPPVSPRAEDCGTEGNTGTANGKERERYRAWRSAIVPPVRPTASHCTLTLSPTVPPPNSAPRTPYRTHCRVPAHTFSVPACLPDCPCALLVPTSTSHVSRPEARGQRCAGCAEEAAAPPFCAPLLSLCAPSCAPAPQCRRAASLDAIEAQRTAHGSPTPTRAHPRCAPPLLPSVPQ